MKGMNITTGIITGTGFYTLPSLSKARREVVPTPYGDVEVEIAMLGGREIALIARHGKQHTIAPAEINFRANIFALKELGVKRISCLECLRVISAGLGTRQPGIDRSVFKLHQRSS